LLWLVASCLAGSSGAQGPYHRELINGLEADSTIDFYRVDSADLDGDGDLDLIAGDEEGVVTYYQNISTPTFPRFRDPFHVLYTNPLAAVQIGSTADPNLADLDGDGDLDAIFGDGTGKIWYYENTGSATEPIFEGPATTSNPFAGLDFGFQCSPDLVDIDHDGDLDAVIGWFPGTLRFFENVGTSTTPAFAEVTGGGNPFAGIGGNNSSGDNPDLVDFDHDGDYDLFLGGRGYTSEVIEVRYFENVGSAESPQFVEVTGADNPLYGINAFEDLVYTNVTFGNGRHPELADLDDDGDLDVFLATTNKIDVFRRGCSGELCLLNDRFDVTAQWTDFQGNTGVARATSLGTDGSGTLWFFSPDNPELAIKMVDGCSYNGHYWFFVTGLTNVEVHLTVKDTESGLTNQYDNPLEMPFQPIQDTAAFESCPQN
jgi:hypothetical protein